MQCSCIEKLKIFKGEKRKVVFYIHSKKNEEFSILSAEINILRYDEVIEGPLTTIENHEISFILDTSNYETGRYEIEIIHIIADEKRIAKFMLEVV